MVQTRAQQASPDLPPKSSTPELDGERHDVRSLTFALLGTFVLRCASYAAGLIIPVSLGLRSRTDSDITAAYAAFIGVAFYSAELIGAPIFGALSDRFGRKPFMLLGPIFGGIAIQLLGITAAVPVFVLVRVLEGFSTASSAPATLGYISAQTATSQRLRGRVMGFYEAATVVGLASGAAVGGRLYEHFGNLAFSLIAVVYVGSLLLFMAVRRHGRLAPPIPQHRSLLRRLLNRRIMRFAPAWLAANAVLGAWLNAGPYLAAGAPDPAQFLMQQRSPGEIGMATLAFGVVFTVGAVVWGFIMPTIGRQATLLWGVAGLGLVSVALWSLNGLGEDPERGAVTPLLLLVVLGVFVESGFTPAALTYLAEIAEEHAPDRGSVMGVYSVLLSVGQLAGTAMAGPFAVAAGFNGLILLTGLLSLIALFSVLLLGYAERRAARLGRARAARAGLA
ncbi:MAG: MFS transporter [Chloroflexota bacterium]|nr:MFS transporter [Chloroflexota bacterium]